MINFGGVMGNLTRDPEAKSTTSTEVSNFSIAVNKEKTGGEKETYFFDCTAFGKTANFVNSYMKKGSRVFVEYSLKQDRWDDKATGAKRYKVSLICNKVTGLDKKSDQQDTDGHEYPDDKPSKYSAPVPDSEIPF